MSETRIRGEQLRFNSANTGEHILDTYLEAAELGGRSLADYLSDIFSSVDGTFRTDIFEFRENPSVAGELQFRVGDFVDPNAGWSAITSTDFQAFVTDAETAQAAAETAQAAAETAATNGQSSESNGMAFATAAASSAGASSNSADNAATSETNAAASATSASSSATAASSSASSASTAQTAAEAAQSAAETAKTAAETAQSSAETAETNASSSASSASTSESNASTSASNASTSETNAAASAAAAATSEANAAASATSAANDLASLSAIWYGAQSSDPSGAVVGSAYLYTGSNPNTFRVLTQTGWEDMINAGVPTFGTGVALPTSNVGVIWHDDYGSLMTWQTFDSSGASYTGYASTDVGMFQFDGQPTARTGYLKLGGQTVSKTTYAGLWNWAVHNELDVTSGSWSSGTFHFEDVDGSNFKLPHLGGQTIRAVDDGAGVDSGRAHGSQQGNQNAAHTHTFIDTTGTGGSHNHSWSDTSSTAGNHKHTVNWGRGDGDNARYRQANNDGSADSNVMPSNQGNHTHAVSGTTSTVSAHSHTISGTTSSNGGSEVRVENTALLAVIKI